MFSMQPKFIFRHVVLLGIIYLFSNPLQAQQWNQIGNALSSGNTSDDFGYDIGMSDDASTIVVGIPYDGNTGGAIVYRKSTATNAWEQMGSTINGTADSDRLGYSVAIDEDGNTIALSLPGIDNPTIQVGKVRVYELENGDWVQKGTDINTSGGFEFGWEVDLDNAGESVAITSIGDEGGDVVYAWNGTDWLQKGQLFAEVGNFSPFSVALSGDGTHVVFGSPNLFGLVDEPGSVYVYTWTGSVWSLVGDAIIADVDYNDFGEAVATSLDGNRIAVGTSDFRDDNNDTRGAVQVFEFAGGAWQQLGSTLLGEGEYDEFGSDVKMNAQGTSLVVGAIKNDNPGGGNAGQARVFDWNGSDWVQRGDDLDGNDFNENFGESVAMSGDGQQIVVASSSISQVRSYEWATASSVKNELSLNYSFGPNPTTDKVTIHFEENIEELLVEVYDLLGRQLQAQYFYAVAQVAVALPGDQGLYLVKLSTDDGQLTIPVVKEQ